MDSTRQPPSLEAKVAARIQLNPRQVRPQIADRNKLIYATYKACEWPVVARIAKEFGLSRWHTHTIIQKAKRREAKEG